jgi:hypothetical protein
MAEWSKALVLGTSLRARVRTPLCVFFLKFIFKPEMQLLFVFAFF